MKKILLLLLSLMIVTACSPKTGIEVTDAWTRAAPQGENGAVYFVITNYSADDELVGVSTEIAEVVEIHESEMTLDVMQMQMIHSVPLISGERVQFSPGGLHVMLANLQRDLQIGETIEIVLHFANSTEMTVSLPVQAGPDHSELDE